MGVTGIQESKIAAKFSKRPSIRTVTSLRDISEETWIHSYAINGGKVRIQKESENDRYLQFCLWEIKCVNY